LIFPNVKNRSARKLASWHDSFIAVQYLCGIFQRHRKHDFERGASRRVQAAQPTAEGVYDNPPPAKVIITCAIT
jgi:hypothetical protein